VAIRGHEARPPDRALDTRFKLLAGLRALRVAACAGELPSSPCIDAPFREHGA